MDDDLRAGIEALIERYRWGGLLAETWVPGEQVLALLAAHPVQDEVTFETNLLDPVWLTTSSSRCTTRPVPAPVQVTAAEERDEIRAYLVTLLTDLDAPPARIAIELERFDADHPEVTP